MALKSILVKHKEKSLPSNRLECRICKQRFWMTCKFIDHMSTHKHFLFSCNICNRGFYDQKQLDDHYITHKEVVNTYNCNQCTRKFLQKYQLEQHMQFHISPVSSNESSVIKKKTVHFNNILESRNINDDFSDDDFYEDYKPSNKLTKTRSGRIVKAKKLFDDELEVKRRRKSSEEVCAKASGSTEKVEQPPRLKTVNKINDVTSSPSNSSISPEKIAAKKLLIITEKIPEHVYKSYVAKGNICTYDTSKNQKSGIGNVFTNSQTKYSINGSMDNDKKVTCSDVIHSDSTELSQNLNKKPLDNNSKSCTIFYGSQSTGTSNCDNVTNISKRSDSQVSIADTNINPSNKSDLTSSKNSNANSPQLLKNLTSNQINAVMVHTSPPSNPNVITSYINNSRVDKQFLYVGPKQDINKIKTIIEEMKTMSSSKVHNSESESAVKANNCRLSPSTCSKSPQKVGNEEKPDGNELHELNSTNGILEKKVVRDFILIKVTPELMQKMQRNTLACQPIKQERSKASNKVKSQSYCADISPGSSSLNEVPHMIKMDTVEVKDASIAPKVVLTSDSNTAVKTTETHAEIHQNSKTVCVHKSVNTEKTPKESTESDTLNDKECTQIISLQFECGSNFSKKEKLLERYRAKIEEKQRKKKEKYEFKKKMRYMEKILCINKLNATVSTKKKSKLPNPSISNKYNKVMLVSKETTNKYTILVKNHEKNAELALKSNKKSLINKYQSPIIKFCRSKSELKGPNPTTQVSANSPTFNKYSELSSKCVVANPSSCLVRPFVQSKLHKFTEKEAVEKAREISLKFEKTLNEEECLSLLDELDNIITNFNVVKKCPFLFPIIRFCRLYVESYKVKERAIFLHKKIAKASTVLPTV